MNRFLVAAFVLFSSSLAFGQSKCFENSGLKDGHSIEMSITGRSVTGSFGVAPDFDTDGVKRYDFTGTISGTVLTVKFSDQSPDSLPTTPASKRWTMVRSANGEKLRMTLFGKNYETNKWSNYTVDYAACKDPYDEAAAKRITFAKGTSAWVAVVSFASKSEKKSYKLGLRAGQRLSVSAPGCGISFFYPNKTPYEEGNAVDTWGSEKLPKSGDYLFVVSPAGEPGKCSVRFEAR